ncbi:BrxA family protein [Terrisporobacter glycolicus]|uniref:BrxA family protein n=1 Tax=Terrisporobacter glycolicus TaxID=36841 RepID=UPI003F5BC89A
MKENFRRKIASGIILRLNTLDKYLIDLLPNSNLEVSKQVITYSIMKSDQCFFDFMNEIYKDKIILKNFKIKNSDLKVFINKKQEQIQLLLGKVLQSKD